MDALIKETIENLKSNNMEAFYVDKKEDVVPLIKTLLNKNDTVSVGGSVSLFECNVLELLRNGEYNFLDRYKEGLSKDDIAKIYRESFFADVYLTSSNAIIKSGQLYNVDGNANRVAAIMFGPKSVIIVVGKNKIVDNFDKAVERVKKIAAPKNTKRLSCDTYCNLKGECVKSASGCEEPFAGCKSESRICANYCISSYQKIKNRIKVIIVGEDVGY